MINVVIVDDHKMFRESLQKMFHVEGFAKVLGEASNGKECLALLENVQPDVLLMDISMPVMDGIDAAKKAVELYPDIKILTLSSFGDEHYYYTMIEAGVKGFVLKSAGITELMQAINEVAAGGCWFSNELLRKVIANIGKGTAKDKVAVELSERELQVLGCICNGLTNDQIATELNLSYDTIKWHRANILSKTNTVNTAALVMYAIKNKFIQV
jgi:DNA-binding NarL/FixJ family response regulator